MRTILVGLLATAGIAIATPVVPASAQVTVDTPIGGVSVGHRHYYRDYDRPRSRGYHEGYRVYARAGGCRTVTITPDDGSFKRIRRCVQPFLIGRLEPFPLKRGYRFSRYASQTP